MTGEAWPDIAQAVLAEHPTAWIFFVGYILVSTFVVLNLFTAVVVSAMEPERSEENKHDAALLKEIRALRAEVAIIRQEMPRETVDASPGPGHTSRAGSQDKSTPDTRPTPRRGA